MTSDQTSTASAPTRELLDTLIERWQEVADEYASDHGSHDDLDLKYDHFRTIYLRLIRDLQHVLAEGQIPCSLMSVTERRRGDCGHIHDDPVRTLSPAASRAASPIVTHICHLLLDHEARGDHAARDLTWALKREGIDLTSAIEKRITELTLGPDPSDPPF
ncbi:hypothetical protein MUK60_07685 [Streptomyces sp. LRE541]|uniref:hypothetical protein n=1 Tax=Streptomyces sp. LRE541 TaxID=2931983 RepID=UPI00200E722D|nr:hypothetical protein [Streptomyces sp. LRE541]UPZ27715.1 hypothetical protein MUK60_07685 [Streptomyces sp. LRE541]